MTSETHHGPIYLLGASGKLGRMVLANWRGKSGEDVEIIPVYRTAGKGEQALIWRPGSPVPAGLTGSAVLALWGVTGNDPRSLRVNTELAIAAMEFSAAVGARRVLHCSSAAVYTPAPGALAEEAATGGPSPYGQAKFAMEQALDQWQADNPDGPEACSLRIGNVAGADSLFANMRPGDVITLDRFKDGSGPRRSYLAPADLTLGMFACLKIDVLPKVMNLAAPVPTEMDALANAAGCEVQWRAAPDTAAQVVWLDTARMNGIYPINTGCGAADYLVRDAASTGVWP